MRLKSGCNDLAVFLSAVGLDYVLWALHFYSSCYFVTLWFSSHSLWTDYMRETNSNFLSISTRRSRILRCTATTYSIAQNI